MSFDETAKSRPGAGRLRSGRALRVTVKVAAGAALLLTVATLVWPVEREVHAALSGQAPGPVTMERPLTRQPEIGQIAIPLHKRKKFEPATATRQDMPYAWRVDNGQVYARRESVPAGTDRVSSAAAGPAAQSTPAQEPTGEAPTTAYGHGGW